MGALTVQKETMGTGYVVHAGAQLAGAITPLKTSSLLPIDMVAAALAGGTVRALSKNVQLHFRRGSTGEFDLCARRRGDPIPDPSIRIAGEGIDMSAVIAAFDALKAGAPRNVPSRGVARKPAPKSH